MSTCLSGMPSYLRDLMYADKEDTSNGKVKKGRHKNVYIPTSVSVKHSLHKSKTRSVPMKSKRNSLSQISKSPRSINI